MIEDELSARIIKAAYEVHSELGPGLKEYVYEKVLAVALQQAGMKVETQVKVPVKYKGIEVDCGARMDLLVEGKVIIELKSVDQLHPLHEAQTLVYLRFANKKLALLLNFNVLRLSQGGIRRLSR